MILVMVNNLRFKLISFAFASILLTLVIAGISIDFLLGGLYGDQAEHDATHAYELVYEKIKTLERGIATQSLMTSIDPVVVASVNLINRYQDIQNYQPLVFDDEKKNLANYLLNE